MTLCPPLENVHAGDQGTVIYIDVLAQGESLTNALDSMTTRTVKIKRPSGSILTITDVPTGVDSKDGLTKLMVQTGDQVGDALTGLGAFVLATDETGYWQAVPVVGDSAGQWGGDPVGLFLVKGEFEA